MVYTIEFGGFLQGLWSHYPDAEKINQESGWLTASSPSA